MTTLQEHEAIQRAKRVLEESVIFRTNITDVIRREVDNSMTSGANLGYIHIRDKEPKLPYRVAKFSTASVNKLMASDDW